MKSFHLYLQSILLYSFVSTIYSQEYPLTFNPYTMEIYHLNEKSSSSSQQDNRPCAVACLARRDNDKEKHFVRNISMHHKSLFMQQITTVHQQQVSNQVDCHGKFQLSLLIHSSKDGNFVEFGYEVYFEKSKFPDKDIIISNPSNFFEIRAQAVGFKRTSRWMTDHRFSFKKDQRKMEFRNWGFIWLLQIKVRYKVSSWTFISMKYDVTPITIDELQMKCRNYDSDGVVFHTSTGKPFDDYYNFSQRDVFKAVEKPVGYCVKGNDHCVRKYELLMPYHYLSHDSESIECSNLTSVPIWDDIPEELTTRIKIFLIAIAQVAGRKLIILPGVIDVLALPKTGHKGLKKIYLSPGEKKLPVPRIIYKLLRYRSHRCEEKFDLCWFNVVIVIQNHPDFTERRLCLKDKCQEWGWDYVQLADIKILNLNVVSKFIYCCRLTEKIGRLLNFHVGKTNHEDLNLNHFPWYDEKSGKLTYHRIQNLFEQRYRELTQIKSR